MTNLLLALLISVSAYAQTGPVSSGSPQSQIEYFLAVDRLDFYTESLVEFLEGKKSPQLLQEIRNLRVEDYLAANLSLNDLNNIEKWDALIVTTLSKKFPSEHFNATDLTWNYNFLKRKLLERFKLHDISSSLRNDISRVPPSTPPPQLQSLAVETLDNTDVLLDIEHYSSEKTTRAIVWDAIQNSRKFRFQIGTAMDFNEYVTNSGIQLISEVLPPSRNYNKIFLALDRQGEYFYLINTLSGQDRVRHFMAQLGLLRLNGKSYTDSEKTVTVVGSANNFQQKMTQDLIDLYKGLPHADRVIIGQKGAIEGYLELMAQTDAINSEQGTHLETDPKRKANIQDLFQNTDSAKFGLETKQFDIEMPSHDFSDYLLLDKDGKIQRWRLISAVWGDEITPIAKALQATQHEDIVYIGTAGAFQNKGIQVGDLVAGQSVFTDDGKELSFATDALSQSLKKVKVTQVHTPFEENRRWLVGAENKGDIVEVETSYLRENNSSPHLRTYFLISDIVGGDTGENLSHAAASSGKRKSSQMKLIRELLKEKGISTPISHFSPLPARNDYQRILSILQELRHSRDLSSLAQIAHKAIRLHIQTKEGLAKLLAQEPPFTDRDMTLALTRIDDTLAQLQRLLPENAKISVLSGDLINGVLNPQKKSRIFISISPNENQKNISDIQLQSLKNTAGPNIEINFIKNTKQLPSQAQFLNYQEAGTFIQQFNRTAYQAVGLSIGVNSAGTLKVSEVPGLGTGLPPMCHKIYSH